MIKCNKCTNKAEVHYSWETDGGEREVKLCHPCTLIWRSRYRYMIDLIKVNDIFMDEE